MEGVVAGGQRELAHELETVVESLSEAAADLGSGLAGVGDGGGGGGGS